MNQFYIYHPCYLELVLPRGRTDVPRSRERWTNSYLSFTSKLQECFPKSCWACHHKWEVSTWLVKVTACLFQVTACLTDRFQRAAHARGAPLGPGQEKMTAHLCHNGEPDEGQSFLSVSIWLFISKLLIWRLSVWRVRERGWWRDPTCSTWIIARWWRTAPT
jgi:hypothetical protein